jgi:hypothetical protein
MEQLGGAVELAKQVLSLLSCTPIFFDQLILPNLS